MKFIVGLGNPGQKYANNRHNAGHMVVDFLNEERRMKKEEWKTIKTDCYMNESGKFIKKIATSYQLPATSLYIVHDDLDIPLGSFKIQFASGPKIHNGLASIEEELGTDRFWRVRIGVDTRQNEEGPRQGGEEYVLSDFTPAEREQLQEVFSRVATRLKSI